MHVVTKKRDRDPDPYLDPLGQALRTLRQQSGQTAVRVAERTQLSSTEISGYETGKRKPGLDNLVRYLRGVDADFEDLQRALEGVGAPALSSDSEDRGRPEPRPEVRPGLERLMERYVQRALERILEEEEENNPFRGSRAS